MSGAGPGTGFGADGISSRELEAAVAAADVPTDISSALSCLAGGEGRESSDPHAVIQLSASGTTGIYTAVSSRTSSSLPEVARGRGGPVTHCSTPERPVGAAVRVASADGVAVRWDGELLDTDINESFA
jgi:hypothetical protein